MTAHDPYPRTPDPPDPDALPHADLLARVRAANPDRMAESLMPSQWRDIFESHADLRVMEQREQEAGE